MSTHTVTIHSGDWPSLTIAATDRFGKEVDVELEQRAAMECRDQMRVHHAVAAVFAGHDVVRLADENDRTLDCFPVDVPAIKARIVTTVGHYVTGPRGGTKVAGSMDEAEAEAKHLSRQGQRYEATEAQWRRVPGVHGEKSILRSVTYKRAKVIHRWSAPAT